MVVVFGKREIVEAFVDAIAACQQFGVGFAGIDDGLDLRIGQKAGFDQPFRQQGPVGREAAVSTEAMAADCTSFVGCGFAPAIVIVCTS